jgi:hypothetical protein
LLSDAESDSVAIARGDDSVATSDATSFATTISRAKATAGSAAIGNLSKATSKANAKANFLSQADATAGAFTLWEWGAGGLRAVMWVS